MKQSRSLIALAILDENHGIGLNRVLKVINRKQKQYYKKKMKKKNQASKILKNSNFEHAFH
jgi:hypothetical protein